LRLDTQSVGRRDQVRLVRAEEIEHRAQNRSISKPGTQAFRGQAGKRQQPFRPVGLTDDPAQRGQRQGLRIGCRGWRLPENCQPRFLGIELASRR